MKMKQLVTQQFEEQFNAKPHFIVNAPGRVNLIGEHTDYNLGFSLPMAIDRAMWIAMRPRSDRLVNLHSLDFPTPAFFSLDNFNHEEGWAEYVAGMSWALQGAGLPLCGWEGVLASDIPIASGLSSSAALELVVARAFWAITRWDWDDIEIAKVAKQHENKWMGLQSGIMDQMISAIGEAGKAFLLDFKDLSYRAVPLPENTTVLVMNTKVPRGLVESAYNNRVKECLLACRYFGVASLRELSLEQLLERESVMDEVVYRRARHVITENRRTQSAAEYMSAGNAEKLGELMNASHASLRDDYEVSCKELNLMVDYAIGQPGCYGTRMTGAGFGGCAIALVDVNREGVIARRIAELYVRETGIVPELYMCNPSEGASLVQAFQEEITNLK